MFPYYNSAEKEDFSCIVSEKILSADSFCSKREKAHGRKFEKLFSERDTDYCDTPEYSAEKSGEGNFPTENRDPKDVEKCVSEFYWFMGNFFFERKSAKSGNFKTLNSGGNSDYRYAKKDSGKKPFKPKNKSPEDEPKNISDSFQSITFL